MNFMPPEPARERKGLQPARKFVYKVFYCLKELIAMSKAKC
tara:strand:- start:354 stop:476 length:123 start_codon:yes stop_codon:yes gene_type:complete